MKRLIPQHEQHKRRGLMTPFIAVAILVVGAGMALVIDHIWLGTAHNQLRSAAEAAALAGARQLVNDQDLVAPPTTDYELDRRDDLVYHYAANLAWENRIAGRPLELITGPEGDIHIGKLVYNEQNDGPMFLEHRHNPTTVVVLAERTKYRRNPVALFMNQLAGQKAVDVRAFAEATIDNRVIGLKPTQSINVPALPIAVEVNESTIAHDYIAQFFQKGEGDSYRFDADQQQVESESDGLSEVVIEMPFWSMETTTVVPTEHQWGMLLDFNTQVETDLVVAQIQNGLTVLDFDSLGGELPLGYEASSHLVGEPTLEREAAETLQSLVGQTRLLFLHTTTLGETPQTQPLKIVEAIGVRVMNVEIDGSLKLTVQPAVLTTKTAQLTDVPIYHAHPDDYRNPTIYNLSLTH